MTEKKETRLPADDLLRQMKRKADMELTKLGYYVMIGATVLEATICLYQLLVAHNPALIIINGAGAGGSASVANYLSNRFNNLLAEQKKDEIGRNN